jgi:hypothetical protein
MVMARRLNNAQSSIIEEVRGASATALLRMHKYKMHK